MKDEATQRDDQHAAAGRVDERDPAPASLPWLEDAAEELFGATPLRSAPTKSAL